MKDISLHLLDIAENSVTAGAKNIRICIVEHPENDLYALNIEDDGKGMEESFAARATDPWTTTRTSRPVGMGLALLEQNCQLAGGTLRIISAPNHGTRITAIFGFSHINRPPAGNLVSSLRLLIAANPHLHIDYRHVGPKGEFSFTTRQIKETIGDLPLNHPEILKIVSEFIRENLTLIGAEVQIQNNSKLAENDKNHPVNEHIKL